MPFSLSVPRDFRKLLAFGHGVGIQAGDHNLEVIAVRVRPSGTQVLGRTTIAKYDERPAAEWGAQYLEFLKKLGVAHVAATVLLPRRDVIARQITLPGVSAGDLENAIGFQIDSLHPYGQEEVAWGWIPLGGGAALVGVVRRPVVDRYVQLFMEAGVAVSSFTFSASAVHAAVRLNGVHAGLAGAPGFMAISPAADGGVEVYGESPARPVFSAEFHLPAERAAVLAASELRLGPEIEPVPLEAMLPRPLANPVENDLSRNALPYATALAGACPRLAPAANLLPAEFRKSTSRAMLIPTAILAAALLLTAAAIMIYGRWADARYLKKIEAEIGQLEPQARRAASLDREIERVRARARMLDEFRGRTRMDLDALNELTRLVAPPAWTNSIDLMRDSARLSGEAPQASSLLKIIDSSPLFENSEFTVISRAQQSELFQIRTNREVRK